jgi:hypothetical protein
MKKKKGAEARKKVVTVPVSKVIAMRIDDKPSFMRGVCQ